MKKIAHETGLPDAAADLVWVRDLKSGRLLEVNRAAARRLGCSSEELLGRSVFELYYTPKDQSLDKAFAREVAKRGAAFLEASFRTKAGGILSLELRGSRTKHEGKAAVLVVARELNDAYQGHSRGLAFFQAFKRSNDVMFYCDRNAVILDVNDAFTRHYGWTREETVGRTPNLLRSRHSTDELYKRMWTSLLDPAKGYWRGEMINKAKDGREVPLLLAITTVRDAEGGLLGFMSNAIDLSDQFALQARVAQSEALAGIGEMAAVVAHEIRNPLSSIVMAANQIASDQLVPEDRDLALQVLRTESLRLNEALTNFLSYARPREVKHVRGDLNAIIEEVSAIVFSNEELAGDVSAQVSLASGLPPFPMDPDQIRQVVWNMILNAVQAVEGRGTVAISTGRRRGFAFFAVKDSGPGIPEERRASLFKPFQTTKQQGTGLGLAIADRIIKAHGGRIELDSPPGEGASFVVLLPSLED